MIFVTLGSQKFQFNRLLEYIDMLIDNNLIDNNVFAQRGYSDYVPKNYEYDDFLDRDKYLEKMNNSSIVITHSGTGAIVSALKANKKVIAVPRLSKYEEHVDNHQIEIAEIFSEKNYIEKALDFEELKEVILKIDHLSYTRFTSNKNNFLEKLTKVIESTG